MKIKSNVILILLSIAILVACVLPVILNENAAISFNSASPIVFGICSSIYAIIAFMNKEQGNLFVLGRNKLFIAFLRSQSDDKPNTDSDEYKNEFALSAFIFCASIPLYIPLAFFAKNFYTALSSALSVTILRILFTFILVLIPRIIKNMQEKKQGRIKDEADRKEQERRESMGKWK
ncbi:MAG: hypothetical protein IJY69_01680 [Clostridia bacterium]|nr:hypothetical protein [Clostridia bacterium]